MFRASISFFTCQSFSSEKRMSIIYFQASENDDLKKISIEKFKNNRLFQNEISCLCDNVIWFKPLVQILNQKYSFALFCEQKKRLLSTKYMENLIEEGIKKTDSIEVNSDFTQIIDHAMNSIIIPYRINISLFRLVERWLEDYFNTYKDSLLELLNIDIMEIFDDTYIMEESGHSE